MAADARRLVERAITRSVAQHALWSSGARLVVAVSGGADSLCLLGALLALCKRGHPLAPGELIVAHLDHGLRGEESREDARAVARLCAELGVPCVIEAAAPPPTTGLGTSLEDWARRTRYAFLRRVAAKHHAERIVTGHTRDDQAETILLHWLRGSGLAGLRGMAPLREDIAHPLLGVTHEQTVAYCAAQGWQPREDSSNTDPRFLRNRIRHELLPLLASYNPGIRELLVRNGELLSGDEAYLAAQAQAAWANVAEEMRTGSIRLHREPLQDLPVALRHRIFRIALHRLSGADAQLEARHIAALDQHITDWRTGGRLHLSGEVTARSDYDALVFQKNAASPPSIPGMGRSTASETPPHTWRLPVPGVVEMPELGWRIRAWRIEGPPGSEDAGELPPAPELPSLAFADRSAELGRAESRVYLDAAAIGDALTVRTWQRGDRFHPLGLGGQKKLQDFFSDAKVPRGLRARLPLVFNADHLVWVAGLRLDDRVRLTPTTQAVIALQLEPLTSP
ncbi:MAG TPA: tRNA lysidine(34) synthetase TilS [Ktedonobacterales bacterium]|nr:tRNA lysidine(34) synthetase TilS [Ktedonobacterales bacterium]